MAEDDKETVNTQVEATVQSIDSWEALIGRAKRALLSRVKIPGWLLVIIGVLWALPDWKDKIDFYIDTAQHAKIYLRIDAVVAASPFFSPTLVIVGLLYLVFIGEPKDGQLRHPIWNLVAWVLLAASFATILAAFGAGFIEIEIRRLANIRAEQIISAGRSNGGNLAISQSVSSDQPRNFTGVQKRCLVFELAKLKDVLPILYIASSAGDPEAGSYMYVLQTFVGRSGIDAEPVYGLTPSGPSETGLIIQVLNPANPPAIATKLHDALEVCDLNSSYGKLIHRESSLPLLLFFAPAPL